MRNTLSSIICSCHFYASMLLGFGFYRSCIYSACPIILQPGEGMVVGVPIYALNVFAYGTVFYLMLRPLAQFLNEILERALPPKQHPDC